MESEKAAFTSKISPRLEDISVRASTYMCTLVCKSNWLYLFGIAYAIQDLCIQNTESGVAEACQVSHLV